MHADHQLVGAGHLQERGQPLPHRRLGPDKGVAQGVPHAGHLFSFHVVAGLGLGRHEAAPDDKLLFGGYPEGVVVEEGAVRPWEAPGTGFERKANLYRAFAPLMG